jgi:hypothetical protein
MANKIGEGLRKLKGHLFKFSKKEKLDDDFVKILLLTPEAIEERRKEAMRYLLKDYFESKKRREDYMRKLESYGKIRRWFYKRSKSLIYAGMFIKEVIAKPVIIFALACSSAFSMWLGMTVGPIVMRFTETYIISPFDYVLNVVVLFPVGFSPAIISIVLSYFQEKKKSKRLLETYGIRI